MVIHYLLHEKKLPETGTYFDLVENQHVPVEEAIQKAYGVTPDQFDQAVKAYYHSLTPLFVALDASKQPNASPNPPQVYHFPVPVGPNDGAIILKPMRETDARAFVAGIKTRIPDRREAGLRELQALATAPEPGTSVKAEKKAEKKADQEEAPLVAAAGNEVAHRALAWTTCSMASSMRLRKNWAMPLPSTSAICGSVTTWPWLKYRIAKARHTDIQGLPNMMQDLRAVAGLVSGIRRGL